MIRKFKCITKTINPMRNDYEIHLVSRISEIYLFEVSEQESKDFELGQEYDFYFLNQKPKKLSIKIDQDILLTSNGRQFVLKKITQVQSGKTKGQVKEINLYANDNLKSVLQYYLKYEQLNCEASTIEELINQYERLNNHLDMLFGKEVK